MSVKSYYTFTPNSRQAFGAARGGTRKHRGVDRSTSTKPGTRVPALLGGVVVAKLAPASWHGFGHQVTVESVYNGVRHRLSYAHGSAASPLRVGDRVSAGQTVITEGTTGATNGSCVHIEDEVGGKFRDPMPLIRAVARGTSTAPAGSVGRVTVKRPIKDVQRLVGATADGIYGTDTTAKVKAWQKARGLTADGIWGPKSDAKGFPAKPAAPATSKRPTIRRGSKGAAVKLLQQTLKRNYSLYAGKLAVDSDFGPATEAAVKEFQRRAGLAVDGIVGPRTWARLGL